MCGGGQVFIFVRLVSVGAGDGRGAPAAARFHSGRRVRRPRVLREGGGEHGALADHFKRAGPAYPHTTMRCYLCLTHCRREVLIWHRPLSVIGDH